VVEPRTIVITGASRGLGAALAREYARPGCLLGLTAQRSDLLGEVARECEVLDARVHHALVDAADLEGTREFLQAVDREQAIDLVIVNAGRFSGNRAQGVSEPLGSMLDQIRSNLQGAIVTAECAIEIMKPRQRGHIVLILSLAALFPLADAPAYSASKAGLAAYGSAMRELLAPHGIRVSLVYPGHIATQQTMQHVGKLPLLMTSQRAARIIKSGLERGRDTIHFPRLLRWLIQASALLPEQLRHRVNRPFRFHVNEDA